jgi:glyoxylate reductase
MARILVSAPLVGEALDSLRRAGHELRVGEAPTGLTRAELERELPWADALVSLLSNRIDEPLLALAPNLRVVANYAVGVDNIDLRACRARGITVTNTPDVLTDATADLAMALLLAACRSLVPSDALARSGAWKGWAPTEFAGPRVSGADLGIVGFGRIGQAFARRARGFGMKILYHQRRPVSPELEAELGARWAPVDELFEQSDIVSLHCPLTPETRGLVSRERLGRMRRGSVLINTARGACVDEAALADALDSGQLAAAGLDVFAAEPSIPERLRAQPRAVLTSHIGSADAPTRAAMAELCARAILDVLGGRVPPNVVASAADPA